MVRLISRLFQSATPSAAGQAPDDAPPRNRARGTSAPRAGGPLRDAPPARQAGAPPRLPAPSAPLPARDDRWFEGIPHVDANAVAPPPPQPPQPPQPVAFQVPAAPRQPGQAFERGEPGFTPLELNGIRAEGPLLNAVATAQHGAAATNLGIGALAAGLAHEGAGASLNSHALFASWRKHKRYDEQLNAMLDADVRAFRAAAQGAGPGPRLDTLILTRESGGAFRYDPDKLAKLAAGTDPERAAERTHAKDVLLTLYIRDEVAGKRMSRAGYELGRNVIGIASGAALIAGTHGLAAAPAGAAALGAKQAGFALGLVNALDVGKGMRGVKQQWRNDKAREIERGALSRRLALDPTKVPVDTPAAARDAMHAMFQEQSRLDADRQVFGRMFPGRLIDERKATARKEERADLVAAHALTLIDRDLDRYAGEGTATLHAFHRAVHAPGQSITKQRRVLGERIEQDPHLGNAYRLMRDLGMRGREARYAIESLIVRRIEIALANDPASAHARATEAGRTQAERAANGERTEGEIVTMRDVLRRR